VRPDSEAGVVAAEEGAVAVAELAALAEVV